MERVKKVRENSPGKYFDIFSTVTILFLDINGVFSEQPKNSRFLRLDNPDCRMDGLGNGSPKSLSIVCHPVVRESRPLDLDYWKNTKWRSGKWESSMFLRIY